MDLELTSDVIRPGEPVRAELRGAPAEGAEVSVVGQLSAPFTDDVVRELSAVVSGDGEVVLPGPNWPVSGQGPLLRTAWWVVADAEGLPRVSRPLRLDPGPLVVEGPANDDLDEPVRPQDRRTPIISGLVVVAALVGLITAFGTGEAGVRALSGFIGFVALIPLLGSTWGAAERRSIGYVRCRVDPTAAGLRAVLRAHPPEGRDASTLVPSVTLYVAESASASTSPDRADSREEAIVAERPVDLESDGRAWWSGTIPWSDLTGLPPSRATEVGRTSVAVTWAVRFHIAVDRGADAERFKPVLALPDGLDPSLRPRLLLIPQVVLRSGAGD
ncbi:MAG: hypothetical protein AAFZ07_09295 [Actinomycetota bacterium]